MIEALASKAGLSASTIERLAAVIEQVVYTGFALFIFVLAVTQYSAEKSAANLALIAILNLPVPFHAIQLGWQSDTERSFWLGSMPLQIILLIATAGLLFSYILTAQSEADPLLYWAAVLGAVSAVWSNGLRWIMIKRGSFIMLTVLNLASLAIVIIFEFLAIFQGFLNLFLSVVAAKVLYTAVLMVETKVRGGLTFSSQGEVRSFDWRVSLLALSRFMRTNGVFTIMTLLAPSAAIVGRLVQQAIAICRVIQNPLANHTFFHQKSFFRAMLRLQIWFGLVASILFFVVSYWWEGDVPPLLGAMSVFCASLGFAGTFIMRQEGRKMLGIFVEAAAAGSFLAAAVLAYEAQGFIIGLILSECLLFAGGLWVLKSKKANP